jgi:hypothetical protein
MKQFREFPYRGKTRKVEWQGTKGRADKTILQGGSLLVPEADWGPLSGIQGHDPDVLNSEVMERAFQSVIQGHTKGHNVVLFSLCTATRPYSLSRKWKVYLEHFEKYADLVIHSNGGLIPIEAEGQFPYLNYDAHGEKKHDDLYIQVGIRRMKEFLTAHPYKYVLFNFRHNMRNYKVASVVGPWAKQAGLITDFVILPTKEQYLKSQAEGFVNAGFSMYPELWPRMFNPVLEQLKDWSK